MVSLELVSCGLFSHKSLSEFRVRVQLRQFDVGISELSPGFDHMGRTLGRNKYTLMLHAGEIEKNIEAEPYFKSFSLGLIRPSLMQSQQSFNQNRNQLLVKVATIVELRKPYHLGMLFFTLLGVRYMMIMIALQYLILQPVGSGDATCSHIHFSNADTSCIFGANSGARYHIPLSRP